MKIDLTGILEIELNNQNLKMECQGQLIKLTFSSFKALRKFIAFNKKTHFLNLIQEEVKHFSFEYYLLDILIGESCSHLTPNWLNDWFETGQVKIFPKKILTYFLTKIFK